MNRYLKLQARPLWWLPGSAATLLILLLSLGPLTALLWQAGSLAPRTLIADPAPQAGAFYRSDHFPLARKGVPALFAAAGFTGHNAASRDYVQNRYHQPSAEWTSDWVMDAAAVDVNLLYAVGRDLADSREWPRWNAGAEFEAARNASADRRR